jgi:hypothetical protein
LYSQDNAIDELKNEYTKLCEDLFDYNSFPTLPYYIHADDYRGNAGMVIDVDDELTFAILGEGYVKYRRPDGSIYYSRYVRLQKKGDKYYRRDDELVDGIYAAEKEKLYRTMMYVPNRSSRVTRLNTYDITIDNPETFLGILKSHSRNTSFISPIHTLLRMLQITHILKKDYSGDTNYDFIAEVLWKMIDIELKGSLEAGRTYLQLGSERNKVTSGDFYRMHDYYGQIWQLSNFVVLPKDQNL